MSKDMKIAAIDMGTNSFHMVVASIDQEGNLNIVNREKEIVRLGSSGGDMKNITDDAEERAVNCLRSFKKIAESEGAEIIAVATSATREAENKNKFIKKVKKETDISVNVISGIEEARLIFVGASHAIPAYDKSILLFDIGGGSTETVIGKNGEVDFARSAKLGTVRLTKKFFDKGKITDEDILRCRRFIAGEWAAYLMKIKKKEYNEVVCTSGTLENLIVMAHLRKNKFSGESTNGLKVSAKDVLEVINEIIDKKYSDKLKSIKGMDPQRADIILAGALIIEHAIKELGIDEFTFSNFALREGILFDHYNRINDLKINKHLSKIRLKTVLNLANKYHCDIDHAEHIRQISLKIFEGTKKIHKMGLFEEELLEAAALLHDCGFFISFSSHHKHSYYLILNSEMPGFTKIESELIANIARYHRKSMPKASHNNLDYLTSEQVKIVWMLGGILRIAEGIDRRQKAYINDLDIIISDKIYIILKHIQSHESPDIELWGAIRRKEMLEKALNKKIEISLM